MGVDLTRNFGYKFDGQDIIDGELVDMSSADYICGPHYRGEAPFSEPETQSLKKFLDEHNFKIAVNIE